MPALPFGDAPLPYADALTRRDADAIDTVVIHCTELPDLARARSYGERVLYASGTGNSGHWYVDRDGALHRWVPEDRIAHHCRGWNPRSIGIELVNIGRWPHWLHAAHQAMPEAYPQAQVDALVALLHDLRRRFPSLVQIAGHEDLDTDCIDAEDDPAVQVRRKRDPGPLFPWLRVLDAVSLVRLGA